MPYAASPFPGRAVRILFRCLELLVLVLLVLLGLFLLGLLVPLSFLFPHQSSCLVLNNLVLLILL
jgi:hypothetical protein